MTCAKSAGTTSYPAVGTKVPRELGRTHGVAILNTSTCRGPSKFYSTGGAPVPERLPVSIVGGGGTLTTIWERERRLRAAHGAMDELCNALLRLACIATPGFGDPVGEADILTYRIYKRAFDAGVWVEASKSLVKEMVGDYPRQTRERIEDPEDIEVRQALHRAQEFYETDPEGEHVKELAICLLAHAFPTEADKAIDSILDDILEQDVQEILGGYLAVPEPHVQELAPQRRGWSKKTMALTTVLAFLAGLGEGVLCCIVVGVATLAGVLEKCMKSLDMR